MALDNTVLCDKANPAEQESLQSEVVPDPMEGEQTWPTEEELKAGTLKILDLKMFYDYFMQLMHQYFKQFFEHQYSCFYLQLVSSYAYHIFMFFCNFLGTF